MIAKVRIAPIEQWCAAVRETEENPEIYGAPTEVGMFVEILTDTMRVANNCEGREWALTDASLDALIEKTGAIEPDRPCYICEHMLELD